MRKLYTSIFSFFLITNFLISNDKSSNKDSLFNLLHHFKFNRNASFHDTVYYNACLQLGKIYINTQIDSALYYHDFALKIALRLKDENEKWRVAEALRLKGWDNYIKGNYKISIKFIEHSLIISKKLIKKFPESSFDHQQAKKISGLCYLYLGMIYKEKGDYGRALDNFFQSYKIFEETQNTKGMANCLGNIGMVYFDQMDYKRALDAYRKSYDLFKEIGNKKGQASAIGNMGIVYRNLKKHAEALDCYSKALKIYTELNDLQGISSAYLNTGIIYKENKDYKRALDYYFKAQELDVKLGNNSGQAINYGNIGRVYLLQKKIDLAELYFKKAININKRLGNLFYIEADFYGLSEVYSYKKDFKNALFYFKKHIETKDSIYSERNKKASLVKELQFNYEKEKAIKDAEFAQKMAIAKQEKEKQNFISNSLTLGLIIFLIFLLITTNRLYVIRKRKNIIENQKKIIENQKTVLTEQKKILEEKNKDITDSINYSKRIQNAILPSFKKWITFFPESFIIYLPKEIISGDFYWLEEAQGKIYFAVGDCTGHGVPGALISFICSGALSESLQEMKFYRTDDILNNANKIIRKKLPGQDNIHDGMDICLLCWDKTKNKLELCSANISFYYVTNELHEIEPDRVSIGFYQNDFPFTVHELPTENIKYIYLSTDGFYLQSSRENPISIPGKKIFEELLYQCSKLPINEQKNILINAFTEWNKNTEQADDVTLIGINLN